MKKEYIQITKEWHKDPTDLAVERQVLRDYDEQLYGHKFNNREENDQFFIVHKLPALREIDD